MPRFLRENLPVFSPKLYKTSFDIQHTIYLDFKIMEKVKKKLKKFLNKNFRLKFKKLNEFFKHSSCFKKFLCAKLHKNVKMSTLKKNKKSSFFPTLLKFYMMSMCYLDLLMTECMCDTHAT